jgi:hypothetical protein
MSGADGVANPFQFRIQVRSLAPKLEELADEYNRETEPLRVTLNAVLAAGPDGWADALFAAGDQLARRDLSDARWGFTAALDRHCSDRILARHTLLQLARAAASDDRSAFDQWLGCLGAEPAVAAEAVAGLMPFACTLIAHARIAERDRTLERFRGLLRTVKLEIRWDTLTELSPILEAAVRHWIDRDATPDWVTNGRIAPSARRFPGTRSRQSRKE